MFIKLVISLCSILFLTSSVFAGEPEKSYETVIALYQQDYSQSTNTDQMSEHNWNMAADAPKVGSCQLKCTKAGRRCKRNCTKGKTGRPCRVACNATRSSCYSAC